ncbi:MAG: carboxyltransferase domain-containing protein [Paracoccaceae bacterium]|nr:carboxyltransferase domain-containing protein [Paracoccaceae bacterium]
MTSINDTLVSILSFLPFGGGGINVQFEEEIILRANECVIDLGDALKAAPFYVLIELLPSYRSLLVICRPLRSSNTAVGNAVQNQTRALSSGCVTRPL